MIDDHFLDHLADRHGLASPALDVAGKKPVETVFRIVRALLLRQQEHEAVAIGERRPAGAEIVTRRRLRTTVQDDHQRRLRVHRHVFEHAQRAGIGAEPRDLGQTVERRVEVARSRLRARHRAQQGLPLATLPGEAGYLGSETEQVDCPFSTSTLVINGRAYHWFCCNAAEFAVMQHMRLKGRFAYPPDRLLNRANIYYSYNT